MGGLSTSLLIGLQGLEASQAALNATSNNISNSNTPGYTREVPQLSSNAEADVDGSYVGGGVTLDGIQSVRDDLLNLQIQQQTSQQSSVDTQSSSLSTIQSLFSDTGVDLASSLTAFSSSLQQLSANPSSSAVQQAVISAGQNLAQSFNSTASGLTSAQTSADQEVTQTVAQINSLSQQIATLNSQIGQTVPAGQDGGTLQDQRDELVQQLSQLTTVSVTQSTEGEVITTGSGTPLVMAGQSFSLQTTTGTDGMQQVLDSNGNNITTSLTGGQIGGAIQIRDQTIPGYMNTLNTLASQFATAFNSAQASGYDSNGNAGQAFFNIPSGTTGAAAGISVALTSPSQVAISSDGSSGSNGNVANLSAVFTSTLPSGQTPANAYAGLVFQVGNDASNASAQSTAIGQSLLQLTNQQSSVSGVNLDEETTNLIRFQTAYEAAARIISTMQALGTVTLDMGSSQSY
ncbi:MAG TPA: flagellar hook-associated protein FlgK [Acidobacteriaceae bacterium]|jgi:flagellar hook-associated protein 1 FlgK|nr:flagellar hook-associated protein FlgK [Acidobacteriaceae bacterium]